MIIYVENSMESTKLIKLINEFSENAGGYKINAQKLIVFLYNNKRQLEVEIFKTPFIVQFKIF